MFNKIIYENEIFKLDIFENDIKNGSVTTNG